MPWSFRDLPTRPPYEERRKRRYALQDYMDWFGDYGGKKVLEVGSGSGIDSAEFARHGATVTAVDSSGLGNYETCLTLTEAGFSDTVPVKFADAMHLPFPSKSFDLVYCFGVLHHLPAPRYAVREFARVAPEFLGMVYHRDSLLYSYSIKHLGLPFEMAGTPEGTKAYTVGEARKLFGEFYDEVAVEPRYNVVDMPQKRKVKLAIPDSLGLGWHLIIRAKGGGSASK